MHARLKRYLSAAHAYAYVHTNILVGQSGSGRLCITAHLLFGGHSALAGQRPATDVGIQLGVRRLKLPPHVVRSCLELGGQDGVRVIDPLLLLQGSTSHMGA